jgi:hypothetical protein
MRRRLATFTFALLVSMAGLVPRAAAQSSGTWSIRPSETSGEVHLRFQASDAGQGNFDISRSVKASELRGLTTAQMASQAGTTVHFEIVREAGTFACDGNFRQEHGAGTFVFHANPRFALALQALGISGTDQASIRSMAFVDVTTDWTRQMKAAGVDVHTAKQLVEMRIFDVTPDYVRDLRKLGYTITEPRQLTKLSIFHVTPDSIRGLQQAGYHPDAEQLVKMSIFKVTPEFIAQVKQLGYTNVPIDELIRMRIFRVTPDYIRTMRSRGLKDLTVDKLVRMRIAGIN